MRQPRRKPGEPRKVPAADNGGGDILISVTAAPERVRVAWFCGEARQFTVEDLREAIELGDEFSAANQSWLEQPDSTQRRFWGLIQDGNFYANTAMSKGRYVNWAALKRALQATIAEMAKPEAKT